MFGKWITRASSEQRGQIETFGILTSGRGLGLLGSKNRKVMESEVLKSQWGDGLSGKCNMLEGVGTLASQPKDSRDSQGESTQPPSALLSFETRWFCMSLFWRNRENRWAIPRKGRSQILLRFYFVRLSVMISLLESLHLGQWHYLDTLAGSLRLKKEVALISMSFTQDGFWTLAMPV